MTGTIIREFFDMLEDKIRFGMADALLRKTKLEPKGVCTSVGSHDHSKQQKLENTTCTKTKINISTLLQQFGIHVFSTFRKKISAFYEGFHDAFKFLSNIDDTIHVEALKYTLGQNYQLFLLNERKRMK